MALYRRGRVWYYDFQHKGKRYRGSTEETSKLRAHEFEREKRLALRRPVEDISFDDLADKYLKLHAAQKRAPSFYEANVKVLRRHFGRDRPDGRGLMLSAITAGEVDAFLAGRRAAVATATANRSLTILKHMLKLAVRWGHLRESPAGDTRLERERNARENFLDGAGAALLLAKAPDWLRPLVLVALHTGARRGELLALEWGDVDLDRGLLTFRQTKSGEPRVVRMSESVREALKGLPIRLGRVFRNRGGQPLHPDGLTWSFRRAVRLAGLQDFRFHDLRHSAASFMVQAGVPLNTVREILGHKSLGMTLRYAHLAPDHQAEAMAAMDRVKCAPPTKVATPGRAGSAHGVGQRS